MEANQIDHAMIDPLLRQLWAQNGTDLLITYAYRLAFAGAAPNYGLAAAVSIIIFALVALMSLPGFRATKKLEEIG